MRRVACDFHLHSCLSPCGDNDMTPANIAGMASLKGLGAIALTDHNTSKNCPAFFKACEAYGLLPIPGMEMTTAEDIHVVALFPTLQEALAFDEFVGEKRMRIPNRPEIFGDQRIVDEDDNILSLEPDLLINALMMDLSECVESARSFGGLAYPAHIDKHSNGIIATLGFLPEEPPFTCYEIHDRGNIEDYRERFTLGSAGIITSSDAHYLWDIAEGENAMTLELPEDMDGDDLRRYILESFK